jgi:hypothetical protein
VTQETSCGSPPVPFRGGDQPRRPDEAMAGTLKYAAEYQRAVALRQRRNLTMAGSAHAYMPGNALKFYEWLVPRTAARFQWVRQFGSAIT